MSSIQRKLRGNNTYLYKATSKRVNGKVVTGWEYLGPEQGSIRIEMSETVMKQLAKELLKTGISKEQIQKIAKKHRLEINVDSPKMIILENNLLKKTLYIRIK